MKLLHPWLLLLLLLWIPIIYFWLRQRRGGVPSLTISSTHAFARLPLTWKTGLDYVALALRLAAVGALVVAIARPQKFDSLSNSTIYGTDIIIALDISQSMQTPDVHPNRFEAAKDIASDFASKRENDNLGLVAFAGESLTMMPLTNDPEAIIGAISNLQVGSLGNGTAIGDGLITSVNRLVAGKADSKSIILITDGADNASDVDPLVAAQIAKEKGIRVYTIAIGTDQTIPVPTYFDPYAMMFDPIDTETLSKISQMTEGKSYRATDAGTLRNVFKDIDNLQKSILETQHYTITEECFMPWILIALCCLALEILLRLTVLRRLP